MKPFWLLLVGVVVGWAASGVDWTRDAVGQESSAPVVGGERSIRRGEGALRRRGLLPQREGAAPAPSTDAPAFSPNVDATAVPDAAKAEATPSMSGVTTVPRQVTDSEGRTITVYEQQRMGSEPGRSDSANSVGRFQATAYGSPNGNGCYIVDSTTGRTWLIRNGQPPEVVAKTLLVGALDPPLVAPATNVPQVQYREPAESLPYSAGPPTPQDAN